MKNAHLIIVFSILAGLASCDENKNEMDCFPEEVYGTLTNRSQIVVQYNTEHQRNEYQIKAGEDIVFQYSHAAKNCKRVMDDEWVERLTFVIDKDATNFEISGEGLKEVKC